MDGSLHLRGWQVTGDTITKDNWRNLSIVSSKQILENTRLSIMDQKSQSLIQENSLDIWAATANIWTRKA